MKQFESKKEKKERLEFFKGLFSSHDVYVFCNDQFVSLELNVIKRKISTFRNYLSRGISKNDVREIYGSLTEDVFHPDDENWERFSTESNEFVFPGVIQKFEKIIADEKYIVSCSKEPYFTFGERLQLIYLFFEFRNPIKEKKEGAAFIKKIDEFLTNNDAKCKYRDLFLACLLQGTMDNVNDYFSAEYLFNDKAVKKLINKLTELEGKDLLHKDQLYSFDNHKEFEAYKGIKDVLRTRLQT